MTVGNPESSMGASARKPVECTNSLAIKSILSNLII
jgi:hypothetical protein